MMKKQKGIGQVNVQYDEHAKWCKYMELMVNVVSNIFEKSSFLQYWPTYNENVKRDFITKASVTCTEIMDKYEKLCLIDQYHTKLTFKDEFILLWESKKEKDVPEIHAFYDLVLVPLKQ